MIWRYRIAAVGAAIIIAAPPYSARAEFINRYSQWHDLDKESKALYADGLIDGGILYARKCVATLVKASNSCLAQMDGMLQ